MCIPSRPGCIKFISMKYKNRKMYRHMVVFLISLVSQTFPRNRMNYLKFYNEKFKPESVRYQFTETKNCICIKKQNWLVQLRLTYVCLRNKNKKKFTSHWYPHIAVGYRFPFQSYELKENSSFQEKTKIVFYHMSDIVSS